MSTTPAPPPLNLRALGSPRRIIAGLLVRAVVIGFVVALVVVGALSTARHFLPHHHHAVPAVTFVCRPQ